MMFETRNRLFLCSCTISAAMILSLAVSSPLVAGVIEIQFGGLNIEYDGLEIVDIGDPDPLTNVTILVDGILAGPVLTSDVFVDLTIPGVEDIAIAGGTILSDPGGALDIGLDGGFLALDLDAVSVTYVDVFGVFQFTLAATVADVTGQSLPFGLTIDDAVSVSFSTQIDTGSLTDNGVAFITGFTASGTGEVQGAEVPEPAALMLAFFGVVGVGLAMLNKQIFAC